MRFWGGRAVQHSSRTSRKARLFLSPGRLCRRSGAPDIRFGLQVHPVQAEVLQAVFASMQNLKAGAKNFVYLGRFAQLMRFVRKQTVRLLLIFLPVWKLSQLLQVRHSADNRAWCLFFRSLQNSSIGSLKSR